MENAWLLGITAAIHGQVLEAGINTSTEKVWDAFGIFLNDDTTFNKGIIEDYKSFDDLDLSVFQNTALVDFIQGSKLSDEFVPAINVGPTNNDQIKATQNALSSSVSVITGLQERVKARRLHPLQRLLY